ncbi:PEP-CTERM sorting domain-containing protein [Thalassotalea aquiviva]|uniref:PEP-CTERM sorting domain-containing protein n=1 Tax=Thalassotalea aquiviva TaxID=3242415 RepID=UPI00352A665E
MHGIKIFILFLLLTLSFMANSAVITYSSFFHAGTEHVNYKVTVDDVAISGKFLVTYEVTSNVVGKLTGFFFDFGPITEDRTPANSPVWDPDTSDPYADETALGLSNESNPSNSLVCAKAFGDVNSVSSGGCSSTFNIGDFWINGVDYQGFLFDVGLAWKTNDLTPPDTSGQFAINKNGFTLASWGIVGLRGQAVDGDGSAKEFALVSTRRPDDRSLPEPATLFILALGLIGLGAVRKKV